MGGDYCCPYFHSWRNRNRHAFLGSHCGVDGPVQIRAQDLQNMPPYGQRPGVETTEITSTEHFCFHCIRRTKNRQTLIDPCWQSMAHGEDMVCQKTSHLQPCSLHLTSLARVMVHSPSWTLRHSVGPADCLCARTALFTSGSESQDQLCMLAKSSSPTEQAPGITCIWQVPAA